MYGSVSTFPEYIFCDFQRFVQRSISNGTNINGLRFAARAEAPFCGKSTQDLVSVVVDESDSD